MSEVTVQDVQCLILAAGMLAANDNTRNMSIEVLRIASKVSRDLEDEDTVNAIMSILERYHGIPQS